jgi:hypothetical protein
VVVVVLLVITLAAVLVPPAVRAHAARRHAFVVSFSAADPDSSETPVRGVGRSGPVERRRQILGGLLSAMVGTGVVGLLPTFRTLLIVHLFLVDAFLAYVALLAHLGDRRAKQATVVPAAAPAAAPAADDVASVDRSRSRARVQVRLRPALTSDLPPVAAAG